MSRTEDEALVQWQQTLRRWQEQVLKQADSFKEQLAIQREAQDRWFAEMKKLLEQRLGPFPQQPTTMEPQGHNQKKKEDEPRSEVHSKVATQPEAAVNGKKNRSCLSLSSTEVFAKWDRGLCEWCDESYFPGHKCKKIGPNTLFVVVAEEEDPMQLDVGVENHPAVDAPQVFDESPRQNLDEGRQQGNAQPSPDENSGLDVQEESIEEAHSEVGMDEEFHVPLAMPSVEANITSSEWRCREAATYAFGSILEGPSVEKLSPWVQAGLDFLLKAMKDQNNHVKDITAWTLSRIFELLHCPSSVFSVISPAKLEQVLGVVLEGIKDAPNVAEKVGGAIYYLAQGFEDVESSLSDRTPYLTKIIASLIATADRTDTTEIELWSSAYETLNKIHGCCLLVFDPGGMIFLLTWLRLHTIHNLEAGGAVFDPGKIVVLRMLAAEPGPLSRGAGSKATWELHTNMEARFPSFDLEA